MRCEYLKLVSTIERGDSFKSTVPIFVPYKSTTCSTLVPSKRKQTKKKRNKKKEGIEEKWRRKEEDCNHQTFSHIVRTP